MNKDELKDLVMRYFSLTETTQDNNLEKVEFATAKLIDGTEVTNMKDSEFEVGDELHVITAEGEHIVAPSGSHELESGIVVTVSEEGIITGIKRPGEEGEGSLEAEANENVSMSDESTEEKTEMAEDEEIDMKEEIIDAIMGQVGPAIEELRKKMEEAEMRLAEHDEKMQSYMSKPAEAPTSEKKFSKIEDTKVAYNQKRYEAALKKVQTIKRK